jgi:hypothetical protein
LTLRVRTLDAAPREWGALLAADPAATAAHEPALWYALRAALPGMEPAVLEARDGESLVGGAAVTIERRAGMCWIHALPFVLPGAPIALPGRHAEVDDAIGVAIGEMQRERRAVGGEWACYRPGGEGVASSALQRVSGETRWLEAGVIDLGAGIEEARRRMDRKTRQEIARSAARGVRCAEENDALEAAYALHVRQSRAWGGHRPMPLELSRRLVASGVGRVLTARDAGGLLCASLALDGGHETFLWWSGADPDARTPDAFARLLAWAAEWAASRSRQRLNLGASTGLPAVDRFKRALGTTSIRYPLRWLDARHAPPLGRLVAALQTRVRRGRTRGDEA